MTAMIRKRFFTCTSTKTALLLFVVCFIALSSLFRHEDVLVTRWSVEDAPEASLFLPLTRPGWKTGNPEMDNSLHLVGGDFHSPIVDTKGSDAELPPPRARVKRHARRAAT